MRENRYTAIILKKQAFKEGDEIITFFTKELGKVRALAKSVKSAKSKLQQRLQSLFLIDLTLTASSSLPKIIGVEPQKVFANLRENLEAAKMAFYAVELILKFTPDEEKNENMFNLLKEFLEFLDSQQVDAVLSLGLAKFKIGILEASGFDIHIPAAAQPNVPIFFSLQKGGFTYEKALDALSVSHASYNIFKILKLEKFLITKITADTGPEELQRLLSSLIEYHLERKVKSEKYLNSAGVV